MTIDLLSLENALKQHPGAVVALAAAFLAATLVVAIATVSACDWAIARVPRVLVRVLRAIRDRYALRGLVSWIHAPDGRLYLERVHLKGGREQRSDRINVYLHRFLLPDDDRGPHCHPYGWQFSVVLIGGYLEFRLGPQGRRTRWPGAINWIPDGVFHRIAKLFPCANTNEVWTLFVAGPKHGRSWGYMIPGRGFVSKRVAEAEIGSCPRCNFGEACRGLTAATNDRSAA